MFDDFLTRAFVAGLGVAAVAGPLGSFLVWRRMSYFGATLSHSALLGVAAGFALGVSLNLATVVVCLAVAVLLVLLQRTRRLAADTLLGILAHGALALGLVTLAFVEGLRVDLMGYLFGDILAVTRGDIAWVYGGGLLALGVLLLLWRPLLSVTVHAELAAVEGVAVQRTELLFMLLIALVIAVAMKIVGILLITSLMVIPAATARRFAATPEQMAGLAAAAGMLSVAGGLWGSLTWDTPAGPSIVVAATLLFTLVYLLPGRRFRRAG